MKTTQRGFFTEEQWETFLKEGSKIDRDFLDQVVKRWEEAADHIAELEAEIERLREFEVWSEDQRANLNNRCAYLMRENAKLREALEKIVAIDPEKPSRWLYSRQQWYEFARAALQKDEGE